MWDILRLFAIKKSVTDMALILHLIDYYSQGLLSRLSETLIGRVFYYNTAIL